MRAETKSEAKNTLEERALAAVLGMSVHTVRRWRYSNPPKGPAFRRFGRSIRYLRRDVDLFIAEAAVPTRDQRDPEPEPTPVRRPSPRLARAKR